jgi:hypothetical protein
MEDLANFLRCPDFLKLLGSKRWGREAQYDARAGENILPSGTNYFRSTAHETLTISSKRVSL